MDYNEFNFQLENCKQNIINILNNSKLPIGALLYIIKDIYSELNSQYIASVNSYSLQHPTEEQKNTEIQLPQGVQIQTKEENS